MKTMIMRPGRALGVALAVGVLTAVGLPAGATAQEQTRTERQECRCVDRDGKPIENCTCFSFPRVEGIFAQALPGGGRARLGITLGEGDERGAEVQSVMEGGPADKAGIRTGDIITKLDGKNLLEPLGPDQERELDEDQPLPVQRLMAIVRTIEPEQKVEVEYLRDGARATVTIEARNLDTWTVTIPSPTWDVEAFRDRLQDLGGRLKDLRVTIPRERGGVLLYSDSAAPHVLMERTPRAFTLMSPGLTQVSECPGADTGRGFMMAFSDQCMGGLALVELNPGLAEYFGTEGGVLVADVHESSKLGLKPGDVILSVGDREATDPERVCRVLSTYDADETVTLRVMRQKQEITVTGTLGR